MPIPSHVHGAKLKSLARTYSGTELELVESPGSAGGFAISGESGPVQRGRVAGRSAGGGTGYILAEGTTSLDSFGPAVVWAHRHRLDRLVLLSGDNAGGFARRAMLLSSPNRALDLEVLQVTGSELSVAVPTPLPEVPVLSPQTWALAGLINESGARAVDDHGRLVAELAGLEIARVTEVDGSPLLEVGVGQADRELHRLVHSNLEPDAALRRAAAMVALHRRPGADPHPLNRLARERWIRSMLLDDPSLVDASQLDPVPPLWPRSTLLGTQAVAAVGYSAGADEASSASTGRTPVVVVSSVGVDLGLIPEAAEYRERHDPAAELIVVVPTRDRYPITEMLMAMLERSRLVSITPPWEAPVG